MTDSTNPMYAAIIIGSIQLTEDLRDLTMKMIKIHSPTEIVNNEDMQEIKNTIKKGVEIMTDNTRGGELRLMMDLLERINK